MVITEVEPIPLKIPYVRPLTLSRGAAGKPGEPGDAIYLKITTSDGYVGWGEARPMPTWMYETMESVYTSLKKYIAPLLIGEDPFDTAKIQRKLDGALGPVVSSGQPFAKATVDVALHDLMGKMTGLPVNKLIGGKRVDWVELTATISGDLEEIEKYAAEMRRKGYNCFKVIITGRVDEDYQRILTVNEVIGDGEMIVEANQAYTGYTMMKLIDKIREIDGIVFIEQPVSTMDFHGLQRIVKISSIPIAVDESIFTHHDLLKLVNMNALDLLVLKVAKSGITTSLKINHLAEAAGLNCAGSGMTESGVGFAASIHLFSTIDIVSPVTLNGPQLLSDMLVKGLEIEEPKAKVPEKPGLGIEVEESKIEEFKVEL